MLVVVMTQLLCDQDTMHEASRKQEVNSFPPPHRDELAKLESFGLAGMGSSKRKQKQGLRTTLLGERELDQLLLSSLITPKGSFFAGTLSKQLYVAFS